MNLPIIILAIVNGNVFIDAGFVAFNRRYETSFRYRHSFSSYSKSTKGERSGSEDDFVMPPPETLISEIPSSKRGIGVGVDLGTTNSAVSILNSENIPQIIQVQGKSTVPSIFKLDGSNTGHDEDNYYCYRHVKRVIGMGTVAAASSSEVVPYLAIQTASQRRKGLSMNKKYKKEGLGSMNLEQILREAKENPARLKLPNGFHLDEGDENENEFDQDTVSPEYISSRILKTLFDAAEESTGDKITRAVIGVPAYFNDMQREATMKAATLASKIPRERIRLMREPEAAALAYGIGKQQMGKGDEEELVLVFDLGGGTFDVSILEVGGGVFEAIATGGNNMLGGSDFDAKIAQHFSKQIVKHGCQKNYWKEGGDVANAMVNQAEKVRIALSNTKEAVLALPLNKEGWINLYMAKTSTSSSDDIIMSLNTSDERFQEIDEVGTSNSTHVLCKLSRKKMELLCLDEFLALLRPVREVAILGGALLPGDASPSAVEAVLQMEEELEMEFAKNSFRFDNFFDESGEAKDDDVSEEMLLQLKQDGLKDQKKKQQRGRKRARNVQKDERKYREQKRKASMDTKSSSGNVKVRDGINGRRITQVVLVGGATRMPAIGRLLAAVTGVVPQKTVNPDEAVALGCAVQVGILDGINTELQVLTPIEAAMMRALAKKRGVRTIEEDDFDDIDQFTEEELF
mmetsp:Transcript_14414/g.17520  ORF Transcript_14414/g.17520 Transcript_14414/m.17520 type:complete len:687 (+) Transcript_14414:112-2172(+)